MSGIAAEARAESSPRVALSGIAASESLAATRDAIASEVRAAFETTGVFRIIRSDVVQAMTHVSPSAACAQQRCAARLGRLVQADYVLIGEVAQRGELVAVALRMIDVRNGSISHRLAFEVSSKRDVLARDVDTGVRSMLGLGTRRPQSATSDDVTLATVDQPAEADACMPDEPATVVAQDYDHSVAWKIEVMRARNAAIN